MAEKAHLHAGHRERLREQFLSAGTDMFRAHQILEYCSLFIYPPTGSYPDLPDTANNLYPAALSEAQTVRT